MDVSVVSTACIPDWFDEIDGGCDVQDDRSAGRYPAVVGVAYAESRLKEIARNADDFLHEVRLFTTKSLEHLRAQSDSVNRLGQN